MSARPATATRPPWPSACRRPDTSRTWARVRGPEDPRSRQPTTTTARCPPRSGRATVRLRFVRKTLTLNRPVQGARCDDGTADQLPDGAGSLPPLAAVEVDGPVATLTMQVDPDGGLRDDYELKLNSYDLGGRHRAGRRRAAPALRAPRGPRGRAHRRRSTRSSAPGPTSRCWPASSHHHKVNFCKFTNETRNAIEDATAQSGQVWLAAVNGTAAGGGYELALACDEIVLVDDRVSAVSLPEVPLLAVLPGTGGLTRVVDKRHVRRDRADVFATRAEGMQGPARPSSGAWSTRSRRAAASPRSCGSAAEAARPRPTARPVRTGVASRRSAGRRDGDDRRSDHVEVRPSTASSASPTITVHGPAGRSRRRRASSTPPAPRPGCSRLPGSSTTRCCDLRFNEPESAPGCCGPGGDAGRRASAAERPLTPRRRPDHWLVREIRLLLGPDPEAPRPLGPHAGRARRAGQLLRRDAGRAGAGRRPVLHARRRQWPDDERPAGHAAAHRRPTTAGTRWPTA